MTRCFPVSHVLRVPPRARTCDGQLRPGPSLGVPRRYPAFAELVQDRCVVDAEVLADAGEGPAHAVEVDCLAHLLGCQATAAHRHLMVMQDPADRFPLDPNSSPSSYTVAPAS